MTRPTTDDTRPDTIRDAFEAILALLQMLIARKFSGLYTSAVRLGVEVGEQLDITHPHSGKSLLALRDLIQRAAEEHNRRTSAAAADMPAERLREMRERCERATPGPWFVNRYDCDGGEINWQVQQEPDPCEVIANITDDEPKRAKHDAAFVAHAREDLPAAIAEIERLNRLVVATANADPSWVERCTTQAAEIERLATALQAERAAWQEASGADSPGHLTAALKARRARLTAVLCERTSDLADEVRALRGERDQSAHTIAALQAERESENEGARRLMARVAALESELAARPAPAADASLEALGRIVRAAWVEVAKKEAKTVPGYVDLWKWLEIPDADTDRKIGEQVVRAVDASRTAPQPQEDDASLESRGDAARRAFSRASNCGEPSPWDRAVPVERRGWIAAVKSADASRPGLTEEQARAWETLYLRAAEFMATYPANYSDEEIAMRAALRAVDDARASRGETGPAPSTTPDDGPPLNLGPGVGGKRIGIRYTSARPSPEAQLPDDAPPPFMPAPRTTRACPNCSPVLGPCRAHAGREP